VKTKAPQAKKTAKKKKAEIKLSHFILELYDCPTSLVDVKFIRDGLNKTVKEARLTKLHEYYYSFDPPGVTGVVVLAESHMAIHTWPKEKYAAVDLFSCGDRDYALRACQVIIDYMKPRKVRRKELRRGITK
jgi:S-adenosylmethionine decarboxylase